MYDDILEDILDEYKENAKKALKYAAEYDKAKAPYKTGELVNSQFIDYENLEFGYDAEHAIVLHENPESKHYKWLEKNMDDIEDRIIEIIGGGE